jgi:hypothetical protein
VGAGEAGGSCERGHEAARGYLEHLVGPIFLTVAHESPTKSSAR